MGIPGSNPIEDEKYIFIFILLKCTSCFIKSNHTENMIFLLCYDSSNDDE